MGADSEEIRTEIKNAISQHLHLHGPRNWDELIKKYPLVSRSTIWRYIREVREQIERMAIDSNAGADLRLVQKRIKSKVSGECSKKQLKKQVPIAPSPAVVVGLGDGAGEVFNFLANFNALVKDASMMREHAVSMAQDGSEKIKNPMVFDRSIARRLELIETWLRAQDLVWNLERMQELYMMIIEEVGKADADTQAAILSRIRTLNNKRGLTIDARLF